PAEPDAARVPWIRLLGVRQTWAIVVGKLMADPIWWFYLYWLPKFLDAKYGIKLAQVALPLIVVYLVADVGSIAGGWLSSGLMKRGWTANRARKTAMLLMALVIVPTAFAPYASSMWTAVLIISLAAAAHQGWSANVYTLASDMFPPSAVGSVSGIGGFAGAMGGVLFQWRIGRILDATGGNYASIFAVCGFDNVPTGHWVVVDGAIKKIANGNVPRVPDGRPLNGGDLMTVDTFGDFELTWEWKVTPGANSGVKYNVSEEMSIGQNGQMTPTA